MGYGYAVAREGVTPVADATLLAGITDTAAVNEIVRINEIFLGGEATASAVNRYVLRRATTVGSLPTAQTPAELSSSGPAAQTAWATTWGTQPITASAPAVWTAAMNAFGGVIRWVAAPQQEILCSGAVAADQQVSLESASGTSVMSCQILFEEI
jgi:hypothetical protein